MNDQPFMQPQEPFNKSVLGSLNEPQNSPSVLSNLMPSQYYGNPSINMSKKIHPEDQKIMMDFIDHARGIMPKAGEDAFNLELDAARIAEHYGIKLKPGTNALASLANALDERLMHDRGEINKSNKELSQDVQALEQQAQPKSVPIAGATNVADDPLAALKQEALKYKSADEFVKAQGAKFNKEQGMAPMNKDILDEWFKAKQHQPFIGNGGNVNPESFGRTKWLSEMAKGEIPKNYEFTPDGKVVLYRGIPKDVSTRGIRWGDFLSPDKGKAGYYGKVERYELDPKTIKALSDSEAVHFGGAKPNLPEQVSMTDLYNEAHAEAAKADPLAALKQEALKYKSADEFVDSQIKRPQATANVWQDTLPSGSKPNSIKEIVNKGGNPLYHDTNAQGVMGILDSGEIKPSQAPFSSIAGQGKRVSTTRNFDNYSRYNKSPYRFIIDESKTGQKAIPDNREEFESIFNKPVSTKSVKSLAIDVTNPALLNDIHSGKLAEVLAKAKEKGITIEPFEGKVLPNEGANAEIQRLTSKSFSDVAPEHNTKLKQLTDLYNQAHKKKK